MWMSSGCCWMRKAWEDENRNQWRSVHYVATTGRNRAPGTTTSCCGTILRRGEFNECDLRCGTTSSDSAVCQATAAVDLGRTVCAGGRASDKGKEKPSQLSGSIAGGRGRRAGTQHSSAADSRGSFSQSEDAGRVRVFPCPVHSSNSGTASGRRRLLESQRTGHSSGRSRHRQDALGGGSGRGCLPTEKTSALHDRGAVGERTDRSQEQERTESRNEPLDALRPDRDRRDGLCGDAGSCRGDDVSDHRRASGTSGGDRDDELAVLGMDDDVSECEVMQGDARPVDRSGAHHRDRERIVSVSKNAGEKRRQQITLSLCPRPTLRPKRVALRAPQGFAPAGG